MYSRSFYTYILASHRHGTLYTGVTNDLVRRVFEHREGIAEGFTKRYGIKRLVWYEAHEAVEAAIQREKNIKALVTQLENYADQKNESELGGPVQTGLPIGRNGSPGQAR